MASRTNLSNLGSGAKAGVGVALVALVGAVYFFIFYNDISSTIETATRAEKGLRDKLAKARQLEFTYQKDLAELTDRQQRQGELKKILPTETEYPSFLSAIQDVANVSGVSLTAWSPRPEVPEEFYARVPMELNLKGRYHQIAKFFYGVGQRDRIINMENIAIRSPKRDGTDVVVETTALATAFRTLDTDKNATDDKRGRASKRRSK